MAISFTPKAKRIFENTRPLELTEHEENGETLYDLDGFLTASGCTEEEINELLESLDCDPGEFEFVTCYDLMKDKDNQGG